MTAELAEGSDAELVAICITTAGRLGMLVEAMKACATANAPPATLLELIVVDNDPAGTARSTVEGFATGSPVPVIYAIEPRRGIAEARNCGIELALQRGARWLAFIDDDSQPCPDWLERLVPELRKQGAKLGGGSNIFRGPDVALNAWQRFVCQGLAELSRRRHQRRQKSRKARDKVIIATGNWCADLNWIKEKRLRFDQRYSATGGEDADFDRNMRASGAKVIFVPDSIVMETLPLSRISLRYQFTRLMFSSIAKYGNYRRARGVVSTLVRAAPQGVFAIVAGPPLFLAAAILAIVYPRLGGLLLVRFSRMMGRAIGTFGGAIGFESEAYRYPEKPD